MQQGRVKKSSVIAVSPYRRIAGGEVINTYGWFYNQKEY